MLSIFLEIAQQIHYILDLSSIVHGGGPDRCPTCNYFTEDMWEYVHAVMVCYLRK